VDEIIRLNFFQIMWLMKGYPIHPGMDGIRKLEIFYPYSVPGGTLKLDKSIKGFVISYSRI